MIFGHAGESFTFRYLDGDGARRSVIALGDELISELERECGLRQFPVAVIPPRRSTTSLYGMTRAIARAPGEREEEVYELVSAVLNVARDIRAFERSRVMSAHAFAKWLATSKPSTRARSHSHRSPSSQH